MANLGKVIYINAEDYSTLLNGGSITKSGTTYTYDSTALYVIKDVSAPEYAETAGYATSAGQATRAMQDGNGNVITTTYEKKPLVIEVDDTDTSVPQGTYASITAALAAGREVVVKVTKNDEDVYYLPLILADNVAELEYNFGANDTNTTYYAQISYSDDFTFLERNLANQEHTHGNITNNGTLQTTDITIANGDKLVVTDASNSNRIARASLTFDGSTTTQALSKKGTWESFAKETYNDSTSDQNYVDLGDTLEDCITKLDKGIAGVGDVALSKADKFKNIVITKSGTSPNYTYSLPSGTTAASIATDLTTNGTVVVCSLDDEIYWYDRTTGSSSSTVLHFKYTDTTADGVVEKDLAIAYSNNAVTLTTTTADLSSKVAKITSTDNAIARYDGTGGQIQNSSAKVTDDGDVSVRNVIVHGTYGNNNTRIITSDNSNNIFVKIGDKTPFVVNDTEVKSGNNYAGTINLGKSATPWNNVYAKKFITQGGTSSQFVKGDGSLDSTAWSNGQDIAFRRTSLGSEPTYIKNLGGASEWIGALKVKSGYGDYFYCAHRNSKYTVISNYKSNNTTVGEYTGEDVKQFFTNNLSDTFMLPVANLETNPWVLTIQTKNIGQNYNITATDVLNLCFFQHNGSAYGYLNSYKIEVLTNLHNDLSTWEWYTVYQRTNVQDRFNGMQIPIWYVDNIHGVSNNYGYICGIRITVSKADSTGSWSTGNFPISGVRLLDRRPSHTPASSIGALDKIGGTMYGDIKFDYGTMYVPTVPVEANDNRAASTAFVKNALSNMGAGGSEMVDVTITGTTSSASFSANPYNAIKAVVDDGKIAVLNASVAPLSITGVLIPVYEYTYSQSGTDYTGYKGKIQNGNYEINVDVQSTSSATVTITSVGSSITVDTALSGTSENPVQNKVIKNALQVKVGGIDTGNTQLISISDGLYSSWSDTAYLTPDAESAGDAEDTFTTVKTLATTDYVDNLVGDIETLLAAI